MEPGILGEMAESQGWNPKCIWNKMYMEYLLVPEIKGNTPKNQEGITNRYSSQLDGTLISQI